MTVCRLPWEWVVRVHRWLELSGKLATAVWVLFVASVVLGVNWKHVVENAINSGRPVAGALTLAIIVPTLLFVAAVGLGPFAGTAGFLVETSRRRRLPA